MTVGKPHKPEGAKESSKISKGQTHMALGVLLLSAIIGLSVVFSSDTEEEVAPAPSPRPPSKTKEKKEKFKFEFAENLADPSLYGHIVRNKQAGTLVNFYSNNCKFCSKLAPEFDKAAMELTGTIALAGIDNEDGEDQVAAFNITRYPTVFWFWNGQMVLELPRASEKTAAQIVEWVNWAASPAVQTLETQADLEENLPTLRQTLHAKARLIVAFNHGSEELREAYEGSAQRLRTSTVFLWIRNSNGGPLLKSYGQDAANDESYEGKADQDDIFAWVSGVLEKAKGA